MAINFAAKAPMLAMASTVGSTVMSVGAQMAQGRIAEFRAKQEKIRLDNIAKQQEIKANEEMAQGQQEAMQLRRRKELAQSQVQQRSAASGFSASDGNTIDIIAGLEEQGEMQAQMAMFGARSRQEGVRAQAEGSRFSGDAALAGGQLAKKAAGIRSFGSLLEGGTNFVTTGQKVGYF